MSTNQRVKTYTCLFISSIIVFLTKPQPQNKQFDLSSSESNTYLTLVFTLFRVTAFPSVLLSWEHKNSFKMKKSFMHANNHPACCCLYKWVSNKGRRRNEGKILHSSSISLLYTMAIQQWMAAAKYILLSVIPDDISWYNIGSRRRCSHLSSAQLKPGFSPLLNFLFSR